ncbi:heavy-metal-associated domain-containing protein [Staphylococcus pseudoxylosus]|uniref:heavy-metal-associated domain-containing protein n=1 Tax=Staphylococcus pseudoxylosus TaxID=2282419 RepID=UPI00398BB03D
MSTNCCNNKAESNTCCTSNSVNENKCCGNEPKVANQNNECCTKNGENIDSTHNISCNAMRNSSEEEDEVATPFLNYNFKVTGMDCSSCAITIEKALSPLDDVTNPKVNFSTSKLSVGLKSQSSINQVTQTLKKLGYGIEENDSNQNYTTFSIEGMDCGSCAKSIEKHLNNLPYVNDTQVSFLTGKMQIDFEGYQTKNIEKEVSKIGYSATLQSNKKIIIQSGVCLISLLYQHYFLSLVLFHLWYHYPF